MEGLQGPTVGVRCRPSTENCISINANQVEVVSNKERRIFFVNNAYASATQNEIYQDLVQPVIDKLLHGFNTCVMAYGQTGSGKTYTMGMDMKVTSEDLGIAPRTIQSIFSQKGNSYIVIELSFMEVYMEEIFDLLSEKREKMQLIDFQPQGLTKIRVDNVDDAFAVMEKGIKSRHVGSTLANHRSSRSHAIFSVYITQNMSIDKCINSKLHLVDLAGSECVSSVSGEMRREGLMINKGLLHLSNVMFALSSAAQEHIPYRNSALTSILKDSLRPQNLIVLIACISPSAEDINETVKTLKFATRVGNIKCNPEAGLVVREQKPTATTPFKRPFTPKKNLSLVTPGRLINKRPALRPLNYTFDSPRTLGRNGKQWLPTSTPAIHATNFSQIPPSPDVTPFTKPKRSATAENDYPDSEWNLLNLSSSTIVDTPVVSNLQDGSVKSGTNLKHPTSSLASTSISNGCSINEDFIRSIVAEVMQHKRSLIADLVQQEISSRICCRSKIDQTFQDNELSPPPPKQLRRSLRLSKAIDPTYVAGEHFLDVPKKCNVSKRYAPEPSASSIRRSTRLSLKPRRDYSSCKTSSPLCIEREKTKSPLNKNDPQKDHNNTILRILQNGNAKNLMALPTIGPKTATIICNARLINGPIDSLSDLKNVKGLPKTFAQRFFWANNIDDEAN